MPMIPEACATEWSAKDAPKHPKSQRRHPKSYPRQVATGKSDIGDVDWIGKFAAAMRPTGRSIVRVSVSGRQNATMSQRAVASCQIAICRHGELAFWRTDSPVSLTGETTPSRISSGRI